MDERVILLDLGRVLIDFDHNIAVKKIKNFCSLDEKEIFNLFFDSELTDRYEKGVISSFDFFKEAKKLLGAEIAYEEFISIWNDIFTPNLKMYEAVESLKDNYRFYLVSNINISHFEYLQNRFRGYFKFFSYMFLSYELGLRKPDSRIYNFIIEYIGTEPQNIIYTDDRAELIDAAIKLGIDGFQFISVPSFKIELCKRNIRLGLALDGIQQK